MTRTVGLLVFGGVEVLDLGGPFEVLSVASRLAGRSGESPPFRPVLIAHDLTPVTARGGLRVLPDCTLDDHPPLDVLLVPGGVVDGLRSDPALLEWVRARSTEAELTASVCTGAFVLAWAGVLTTGRATTHWEDQDELARQFPALEVVPGVSWVDGGAVVTSGGISAGIDMTLHLVERLHSRDLAERTARQMEYRWTDGLWTENGVNA
ncbi:DJ-1/PfpI family protein [Deinococcus koreensis]|uniref:Thiamine biosynthesis protein ThiJ n=1 Tax=Deinococcus koreensis TaxID=2054903 RepID=A0A2K3UV40_9DEIO|nr:DJ-1/PfpI family protein [Deinococcus koreensis]PNY80401.1 thiamine biosynthesis protein ThiJ [Deinococcus koreensis]